MNIEIRNLLKEDISDIAKISIDSWKLEYGDFIPQKYIEKLCYKEKEAGYNSWIFNSDNVSFAAIVDNKVIGFCYGGSNEEEPLGYSAEICELFVRREFQGMGIGIKLLFKTIDALKSKGHSSVVIWNFKDSKSNNFYKHIGGELITTVVQKPEGKEVAVDIFGWDINDLIGILINKIEINKPT